MANDDDAGDDDNNDNDGDDDDYDDDDDAYDDDDNGGDGDDDDDDDDADDDDDDDDAGDDDDDDGDNDADCDDLNARHNKTIQQHKIHAQNTENARRGWNDWWRSTQGKIELVPGRKTSISLATYGRGLDRGGAEGFGEGGGVVYK